MTHDEFMKTLRICSVGNSTDCDECPLHGSHDCHTDMARNALAELETAQNALKMQEDKMSEVAKKHDPVEIVRTVLVKGGYSVTVNPDGTVMCHPWCTEETLELPLVAKFLDNYIRRVEFNVPRMDDAFMEGGWEKVLRKAVEDGEFDDLGDDT